MATYRNVTCSICSVVKLQSIGHKKGTNKFCSNKCQQIKQMIDCVKNETASPRTLKRYLIYTTGNICYKCKNKEWNGLSIPLEIEHVDGNSSNNNLKNLILLCPNCHAQTLTYKGANRGNGRHSRRIRYAEGKSY